MSNERYPEWWDTTITIYNQFKDPTTKVVTWYRTVVEGNFWKYVREKVKIGNTVLETDSTVCRIRQNDKFLEKHIWVQKPNDEMKNYFTLAKGDIIIKGEVNDTIDEYTSGKRSTDLIAKYKELQGCISIDDLSINVGAGRCNEHYLVKGI